MKQSFEYYVDVDGEKVPLAARLLTYQELVNGCEGSEILQGSGSLDNCLYFVENTYFKKYVNYKMNDYWLETHKEGAMSQAISVGGYNIRVWDGQVTSNKLGIRPVIEVKKTDIEI